MVILNMCQKWGGWVGPSAILDHMVNGPHGVLDFFIATHLSQTQIILKTKSFLIILKASLIKQPYRTKSTHWKKNRQ